MPSLKIDASLRLIAHLPDESGGRFHFTVLRKVGDRITPLEPTACALLFPELATHLTLHGSDIDGVPQNVGANAWYHAAGIYFPGEAFADHSGATECGHRLRRLLRMSPEVLGELLAKLQGAYDEHCGDARAVHARLEEMVGLQRLRWRMEAGNACAAITAAMESLTDEARMEESDYATA